MPVARQVWRASESRGSSHLALWLLRLRLRPEFRIPTAEYVVQIPLRTIVLVCSKRCAPRKVHCICCFLTNRLLTTWLIVDSTNAVLIGSPCRRRSPKFGMNSRLLQMYVSNSLRPAATFFAACERA